MSESYCFFGWITVEEPYFINDLNEIILFKDVFLYEKRTSSKIIRYYRGFHTIVQTELNCVYFEWIPDMDCGIKEVYWPGAFEVNKPSAYSIIPYLQGLIIPYGYDYDYSKLAFDGQFCSCAAYMPWLSQVQDGRGYIAINQTPWDSKYQIIHSKESTKLQFRWITSLGSMRYSRKIKYIFEDNFDYNRACKIYRNYVKETGLWTSLEEKMSKLPNIKKLIGCSVVHTGIKTHIDSSSRFFDKNKKDVIHSFESIKSMITTLHTLGAQSVYLHLDGWSDFGYDNCHPDIFPPCVDAGGWKGLQDLSNYLNSIGDLFGLHDQYRDYYLSAKTYDINNAVMDEDGTCFEHANWAGGRQNYLCASLAEKHVDRNIMELFNHNIHLDCSYLDVFTCNEPDECFNPKHIMSRKDCLEYRENCFKFLIEHHIIPSSEECSDWAMKSLVFSHYGPYEFMLKDESEKRMGIPVPLFNLVYHDCFILPWPMDKKHEDYMLYALLNGGMPYLVRNAPYDHVDGNFGDDKLGYKDKVNRAKIVSHLFKKVATCEMIRHEFVSKSIQRSYFSNGILVEVDLSNNTYEIKTLQI